MYLYSVSFLFSSFRKDLQWILVNTYVPSLIQDGPKYVTELWFPSNTSQANTFFDIWLSICIIAACTMELLNVIWSCDLNTLTFKFQSRNIFVRVWLSVSFLFTFQVWSCGFVDGRSPSAAAAQHWHGNCVSGCAEQGIHSTGWNVFR